MKTLVSFVAAVLVLIAQGQNGFVERYLDMLDSNATDATDVLVAEPFTPRGAYHASDENSTTSIGIEYVPNSALIDDLLDSKRDRIVLRIQLDEFVLLDLYSIDASKFPTSVHVASCNCEFNMPDVVHYRGVVRGEHGSLVSLSVTEDGLSALIHRNRTTWTLGKSSELARGNYVAVKEVDLDLPIMACSTVEDGHVYSRDELEITENSRTLRCVNMYYEVNYDVYQDKGTVAATANYIVALFNHSSAIYENDGIDLNLGDILVWDTPSPYTGTTTAAILSQFQSFRNTYDGDLAHLIGYAGGGGRAAGFNGLCADNVDNSMCYSGILGSYNAYPIYSASVYVLTHEQGHLLGSRHTHACVWNGNATAIDGCGPNANITPPITYEGVCSGAPIPSNGTVMSYCHLSPNPGIDFALGFGPQPRSVIINGINSSDCLEACQSEPANDDCVNAVLITSSVGCNPTFASVFGAGQSGLPIPFCDNSLSSPSCGINPDMYDVFFSFTAVRTTHIIIVDPIGSGTGSLDPVISIYSGSSCSNLSILDCEDTSGGAGGSSSLLYTSFIPGNQYWIRVYDWCSTLSLTNGDFEICILHPDGNDVTVENVSLNPLVYTPGETIALSCDQCYDGSDLDGDLDNPNIVAYLSTTCSTADALDSDSESSGIGADDPCNSESFSLDIPVGIPSGTYYIIIEADAIDEINEGALESNNLQCFPIEIEAYDCLGVLGGSALPGTPCNDNNPCTSNDVYTGTPPNCNCVGTIQDADGDGVCNANDDCPGTATGVGVNAAGCSCAQVTVDDGDPCTLDQCTNGTVSHTLQDSDADGVCNANDECSGTATGAGVNAVGCSCAQLTVDDGDPCTLDQCTNGTVTHTLQDSDADGVCNANDECLGTATGAGVNAVGCSCAQVTVDDGDPCTLDQCTSGNVTHTLQDADDDGVCNANDECPDTAAGAGVNSDGCSCAQVTVDDGDPCTLDQCTNGNVTHTLQDADGDGVCDAIDECSGTAAGAGVNAAGCSCTQVDVDDGDPCTLDQCSNGVVTHTLQDSDADGVCDANDDCPSTSAGAGVNPDGCSCSQVTVDDGDPCTLDECSNGTVTNTYQDADNDGTCDANDLCNGGPEPGTPCDDGNPETGPDTISTNCECVGIPLGTDCEGVPGGTALPGTPCNDMSVCTTNDRYDVNCNCVGIPVDPDDNNACTTDSCDPLLGVINTPIDPNDDDPCTLDTCNPVAGVSNVVIDSDADGVCDTNDDCPGTADGAGVNLAGCSCAQVDVDDGDPCTVDLCTDGLVSHEPALLGPIGAVNGPATISIGTSYYFWVEEVEGATSYEWSFNGSPWGPGGSDSTYTIQALPTDVCVRPVNISCIGPDTCATFSFSTSIATSEGGNWFVIHPNPSNGTFQLTPAGLASTGTTLQVYDAIGQLVYGPLKLSVSQTFELDLKDRSDGIYVLRATREGESRVFELLIMR